MAQRYYLLKINGPNIGDRDLICSGVVNKFINSPEKGDTFSLLTTAEYFPHFKNIKRGDHLRIELEDSEEEPVVELVLSSFLITYAQNVARVDLR